MKRLLISIFACLTIALSFTITGVAEAQPLAALPSWIPSLSSDKSSLLDNEFFSQLETEILPQLEGIFTPEQLEQFKSSMAGGTTFRKAFKAMALTPEQKTQLKDVFKTVSKKDAFATLTPAQKAQLFMKKKEMFMPTSEEITDKITASIKAKGSVLPEGVKEKIDAKMNMKDSFAPLPESITEKINAGINKLQEAVQE